MQPNVLTILLEADSTGLTTQLSTAGKNISSFVDKMNSQEVDWTSILSKSISPAIITGIAATFADAIVQYTQFQQSASNLNNVATSSTADFANSANSAGGAVYSLAEQSGASLGDTTQAFETFSKAGLDSAAAMGATSDAAAIARDTGESMTAVVQELSELFSNWGVTTLPQVTAALTGLTNGAENGKFSFDELVSSIATQGANLSKKTDIADLAINLAALSTQSGLTKGTIIDTFQAIAQQSSQSISSMNILFKGAAHDISDGPDGLITAFAAINTSIKQYGPAIATTIAQGTGLMSSDVANFAGTAQASFDKAKIAADTLRDHLTPLQKILEDHESEVAKLGAAWNTFIDILASWILPPAIKGLTALLSDATTSLTSIQNLINGTSTDKLGDLLQTASGVAGATGVLAGAGAGALAGGTIGSVVPVLGTAIGAVVGGVAGGALAYGAEKAGVAGSDGSNQASGNLSLALSQAGGLQESFSGNQVNAISENAQQHNDLKQLIDALTSGLSTKSAGYATLNNNFNITAPPGATNLTSQQIAGMLYKQFQNTQ